MSETDDDPDAQTNATDPVVVRAHKRWAKCQRFESIARDRWDMDYKFSNGDAYNNYQWPQDIYSGRGDRPSLTVNETQQHNLHIINEAKQNKAGVKYRPIGDGASPDAAEVLEGIYRHIANISNAQMAQGKAIEFQVTAGLGFTVIRADYMDQDTFDQEIYIRALENPLSCYLDCDAREPDGSDARYGFIFADRPRDEVEEEYPEFKGRAAPTNAVDDNFGWILDDHIREAEYYEVQEKRDELIVSPDGTIGFRSKLTPDLIKMWKAEIEARGNKMQSRTVVTKKVKWYKIIGDQVKDEDDLPGKSVPIIPWCGTVTVIDGELDRKGHTRTMISAQQMINYNWSATAEHGALQTRTPWMASIEAIEGNETYWWDANTTNPAVLPFKAYDDRGQQLPPPQRIDPPTNAPAFMEGIQVAKQFMLSASGQYEAELGAPGNERSGKAINERQRMGERATYHFIDNQALAIRRQGQIILEWIPAIYDTERVLRIIGEDDGEDHVQIDPKAPVAHQPSGEAEAVSGIFNPNVGKYEVVSDVGPDYATQRQEAFNAIVQVLTQAPELIGKIGDLLFKSADFPLADQIAERLKPGLPEEYQVQLSQMQQTAAAQHKLLEQTMQALSEERLKVKAKDSDNVIDAFDADTKRLAALKDFLGLEPAVLKQLVRDAMREANEDDLGPAVGDLMHASEIDASLDGPPGAAGALPVKVPDVGKQMATPGGV